MVRITRGLIVLPSANITHIFFHKSTSFKNLAALLIAYKVLRISMTSMASVASVISAVMPVILVVVIVVVTVNVRVIDQSSVQQSAYSVIRAPGNAAVQLDSGSLQSVLGSGTDTTTNQRINIIALQETGQRSMSVAVPSRNPGFSDFAVLHCIQLELLRVSKMLENVPVFIGDSDFHTIPSLLPLGKYFAGLCPFGTVFPAA